MTCPLTSTVSVMSFFCRLTVVAVIVTVCVPDSDGDDSATCAVAEWTRSPAEGGNPVEAPAEHEEVGSRAITAARLCDQEVVMAIGVKINGTKSSEGILITPVGKTTFPVTIALDGATKTTKATLRASCPA